MGRVDTEFMEDERGDYCGNRSALTVSAGDDLVPAVVAVGPIEPYYFYIGAAVPLAWQCR